MELLSIDLTRSTFLVSVAAALVFTYPFLLVIYRLIFHPYSKYPGPFWARVSFFYSFWHAWVGDTQQTQFRCHQTYGPIVRYAPDNILFHDIQAFKDIHGAGKPFQKGVSYAPMNAQPGVTNLAFSPHKREHARRSRIMRRAFTENSVKDSQPYIKSHVDELCRYLPEQYHMDAGTWSDPCDLSESLFWASVDATTDLIFGESFNTLRDPTHRPFKDVLATVFRRFSLIHYYPHLFRPGVGKWNDIGTWILPNISQKLQAIMMVGVTSTMKRIQDPPKGSENRKDALSYLINGTDPETGTSFTPEDIISEALLLLMAGGDTIAAAMCCLFFYLTRYPEACQKAAQEVRSTFATADEIELGLKMGQCSYLHACIEEGLRMLGGPAKWRDAEQGGAMVCGEFVPEGLTAGISPYVVTRSENYFRDPFKFIPERWIPGGKFSDEEVKLAKAAHHAFLMGPRMCIAKQLAWDMMLLMTAQLLWDFDVRKAEGPLGKTGEGWKGRGRGLEREDEFQVFGSFTIRGDGPVVQFRKRQM